MQDKSNKTMEFKVGKADKNFTEKRFTNYTGLTTDYTLIKRQFYDMHYIITAKKTNVRE